MKGLPTLYLTEQHMDGLIFKDSFFKEFVPIVFRRPSKTEGFLEKQFYEWTMPPPPPNSDVNELSSGDIKTFIFATKCHIVDSTP